MTDMKKYADWLSKLEWEGGLEAVLAHSGPGNTGDAELDSILVDLETVLFMAERRILALGENFLEDDDSHDG